MKMNFKEFVDQLPEPQRKQVKETLKNRKYVRTYSDDTMLLLLAIIVIVVLILITGLVILFVDHAHLPALLTNIGNGKPHIIPIMVFVLVIFGLGFFFSRMNDLHKR